LIEQNGQLLNLAAPEYFHPSIVFSSYPSGCAISIAAPAVRV
jgi:hypothetical protein